MATGRVGGVERVYLCACACACLLSVEDRLKVHLWLALMWGVIERARINWRLGGPGGDASGCGWPCGFAAWVAGGWCVMVNVDCNDRVSWRLGEVVVGSVGACLRDGWVVAVAVTSLRRGRIGAEWWV